MIVVPPLIQGMGNDDAAAAQVTVLGHATAFWTVSLFESEFMGMPFRGRSTLGYDPQKKKWVGTWVDSMSPSMFVMEGGYDAAGKVLTMHCRGPHMATGEMVARPLSS